MLTKVLNLHCHWTGKRPDLTGSTILICSSCLTPLACSHVHSLLNICPKCISNSTCSWLKVSPTTCYWGKLIFWWINHATQKETFKKGHWMDTNDCSQFCLLRNARRCYNLAPTKQRPNVYGAKDPICFLLKSEVYQSCFI